MVPMLLPARVRHGLGALAWLAPCLARLPLGLVFLQSGFWKLQGLARSTTFFVRLGIPAASLLPPFVGLVEIVGGFSSSSDS
jgi:uncharacterized membrane protein YphA (DoxX/SURF4 family)